MDSPLTPKQKRVLDSIRLFRKMKGNMPSVRDIKKLTKSAVGTVQDHLETLERKGRLKINGSARGILLTETASDTTIQGYLMRYGALWVEGISYGILRR